MKYLFVLIFIIVYIINPPLEVWGFSSSSPLILRGVREAGGVGVVLSHITYIFLHAGIIHLLINSLSFLSAWIIMKRFYRKGYFYFIPFALAVITSFIPLCIFDKPTVGASGVVYAMVGMILPYFNFKKSYLFYLSIAVSLIVSFFIHSSNFYLHLFCFIGGVLFTVCYKYFTRKKISKVKKEFIKRLKKSDFSFVEINKPENIYGEKIEGYYYKCPPIEFFKNHLYRELFNYNCLIEMDKYGNCKIYEYDNYDDKIRCIGSFPNHRINEIK